MKRTTALISLIAFGTLHASDGVLEINQACALNGGCFPGDSAGFPVTIDGTAGVSYRLTGSLDLTAITDTIAIEINTPHVTLDLNGFEIAGPVTCTGSGPTLDCGTPGSATGIRVSADGVLIRNGTIRNMDASGVAASGADRLTLYQIRAYNNARNGLSVGNSSVITECIAVENGDDGFDLGIANVVDRSSAEGNGDNGFESPQKVVIDNSSTRRNGGRGYELGPSSRFGNNTGDFNGEPDRCGGGICSSMRRFYITQATFDGSQALTACANGFHMASLWEIRDTSRLAYDTVLGLMGDDSGNGPPSCLGSSAPWVRTGRESEEQAWAGAAHCNNWTSALAGALGSVAHPGCSWDRDHIESDGVGIDLFERWEVNAFECGGAQPVWCVEDS